MIYFLQFIFHMFGDYITQSGWMANNKVKHWWPALVHATVYSIPFALIASPAALAFIWGTHYLIDRFRLIRYVLWAKDQLFSPATAVALCGCEGYVLGIRKWGPHASWTSFREVAASGGMPAATPPHIWFFCMVMGDNTLHFIINFLAIWLLGASVFFQ